jgi:hypothetical protein
VRESPPNEHLKTLQLLAPSHLYIDRSSLTSATQPSHYERVEADSRRSSIHTRQAGIEQALPISEGGESNRVALEDQVCARRAKEVILIPQVDMG